jgi:CheY-like chemotaxis protein
MFSQVDRTTRRAQGGLGIGLTLAKSLVQMHGGTIEAHSEGRDKGSTFRICLPLVSPAESRGAASPPMPSRTVVRPLRILLVEDHGVTAKMMKAVLEAEGHRVATAGDISTAWEIIGQNDFDLLMSDLGLPDGSGHDLMCQLRQRGYRFPGIALSGYGQDEDVRRSYESGFTAHLTKPASRERLIAAIDSIMGSHPMPAEPQRADAPIPSYCSGRLHWPPANFDLQEALRRCVDDREVFEAMVEYFFNEADTVIEELRAAVAADDAASVARVAHRFKGTVGYLGAKPATDATQAVEEMGLSGDLSRAAGLLENLSRQVTLLQAALGQHSRTASERKPQQKSDPAQ